MSTCAFEPTLLRSDGLCHRLLSELRTLNNELCVFLSELRKDPKQVIRRKMMVGIEHVRSAISAPNVLPSCGLAILIVVTLVLVVSLLDRKTKTGITGTDDSTEETPEIARLAFTAIGGPSDVGSEDKGRVGLNHEKGEGSNSQKQRSGGGGSGGNNAPTPSSVGKLLAPSFVPAAIPVSTPRTKASLPVAGIDLDPALFHDIKFPVYGDPRSKTEVASNGPGEDQGIGNNKGTGVGDGVGGGFGPGHDGNTGGDSRQTGCCGIGSSSESCVGEGCNKRPFKVSEVETRPRVISKPEPQYTEEARRNQMMGTVILHVIFSSTGEVTQIQAVKTLPFGLTEKAIAAARRISFVPARKGGNPVSVYMQLEYNFNLY